MPRPFAKLIPQLTSLLLLAVTCAPFATAQAVNPALFSGLRWRHAGPWRSGRVSAVAGAASRPNLYYIGTPGGGVFKTTDGGVVWTPVFDAPGADSIGAVALAPSDSQVVYAGAGEQLPGNGVWGSRDGGATWRHLGLETSQHIDALVVSPKDPSWVVAAAGPGDAAGGIWLSRDGGENWQRTLAPGGLTGAVNIAADPNDGQDLYAATQPSEAPGRRGGVSSASAIPGQIYRSRDGGLTWSPLPATGLPVAGRGKIGLAVAPGLHGERLYAYLTAGLYRSDDGGAHWRQSTRDPRITGGGYFCQIYVDPNDANTVYAVETSFYRSTDAGATFQAFKGAPGGDDYHVLWIDPADSTRMILGVDQGATITVDGGRTWSPWFNQPTAQLYRVAVDQRFPFHMYSSQQDSGGTLALPNRSDYGRVSLQDWYSTGGNENAYSAPDPLDPNFVYVNGWYGNIVRFDRRDGQITTVFVAGSLWPQLGDAVSASGRPVLGSEARPPSDQRERPGQKVASHYREASPAPILFSPTDPHRLYIGTQFLLATDDGGQTWRQLGPDLTGTAASSPAPGGGGRGSRGAAITAIAPSPTNDGILWIGTSNGRVMFSSDAGATWKLALTLRGPIRTIAPTGSATAVVATANQVRITTDQGATWSDAVNGLPAGSPIWAVRTDPRVPALLYAALDGGVYVSFDQGRNWQSLQLNFPPAPVRDLAVTADDLVAATYGRGMWVLDNIAPLRQLAQSTAATSGDQAFLYQPPVAIRVRNDNDQDMPLPAEVPAADNPPAGAIFDYYLPHATSQPLTLRIYDPSGALVRTFSSAPQPPGDVIFNVAPDWFAPPALLPNQAGGNRFSWNLRTADPDVIWPRGFRSFEVGDDATPGESPRQEPEGYLLPPGDYKISLTVDGTPLTRTLHVTMDPRSRLPAASVLRQTTLEAAVNAALTASYNGYQAAVASGNAAAQSRFEALNREFVSYFSAVGSGDGMPNPEVLSVWTADCSNLQHAVSDWHTSHPADALLTAPVCQPEP